MFHSRRGQIVGGDFTLLVLSCVGQDDPVLRERSLGAVHQFNWSEQNHHAGTVLLHGETAGGV